MWIYWSGGKPRYGWEHKGEFAKQYEKNRTTSYMKTRTPVGGHSIAHEVGKLGAGMCMTILDASSFHGYRDVMQSHIEGVRMISDEKAAVDESLDVIRLQDYIRF